MIKIKGRKIKKEQMRNVKERDFSQGKLKKKTKEVTTQERSEKHKSKRWCRIQNRQIRTMLFEY